MRDVSTDQLASPRSDASVPAALGAGVRLRVVHLEGFEEPVVLKDDERAAYRQRFATLFVDEERTRRGGLGSVAWACNAWGETYAVKTMIEPAYGEQEEDDARRLRREQACAAFRAEYDAHRALNGFKGFPRLYGYGLIDGAPAMVMEWIEGITLEQARDELAVDDASRLAPLTAARIGRDLFEVLGRLELVGDGFVHRDISPANVMVRTAHRSLRKQNEEGSFEICLIDFGSAAALAPARGGSFTRAARVVRHATAAYAPPEMLSDDLPHLERLRASAAIDVYAAASVLFELVDGHTPFDLDADDSPGVSPYRVKVDTAPRRLMSAHEADADMASLLVREPDVAVAAGRVARDLALDPDAVELRRALMLVDNQLTELVTPCLASAQAKRPRAQAVHDGLESFCANYVVNIERALTGERLLPCTDRASWFASTSPYAINRLVFTMGRAASYAVLVAVALITALVLDGASAAWEMGPFAWEGHLSFPVVVALLIAPAVSGAWAARDDAGTLRGFVHGSVALALAALVALTAAGPLTLGAPSQAGGALVAVFAACAAGWCPLVLDYAMTVVPALIAEARRALPAGERSAVGVAGRASAIAESSAGRLASGSSDTAGGREAKAVRDETPSGDVNLTAWADDQEKGDAGDGTSDLT